MNRGGDFGGTLCVTAFAILFYLKILGQIDIGWEVVVAPLWAPFAVGAVLSLAAVVCGWFVAGIKAVRKPL